MGGAQKAREKCPNWCGERKQRQERDTWASQSSGGERPWLLRPVFTHTHMHAHTCAPQVAFPAQNLTEGLEGCSHGSLRRTDPCTAASKVSSCTSLF